MKILIADKLSTSAVEKLMNGGHDVVSRPDAKGETLLAALSEVRPTALIVRSTKVSAEAMDQSPDLELIVRAGAGYDNIDVSGASDRGVFVANCPGKNAAAVAELTIGLMLSLDRSIPDNVIDAREGIWNKARYGKASGLKGRTLGVIGLGNIGLEVVRRAHSFDMHVVGWSRSLTNDKAESMGIERVETPVDVAKRADVITLHVAATPETESLAGAEFFDAMRPGAFFINTTRSSVVDEDAMISAMEEKSIRVALDVFSEEPAYKEGEISHTLATRKDVYLTHHIGASTGQAQEAIADEATRVILTYAASNSVPNCVNIADKTPATHQLTVRHLDKVGVLASILEEVRMAEWNVQEMENRVFAGAHAACASIRFDGTVRKEVLERIQANSDVLAVSLIDL